MEQAVCAPGWLRRHSMAAGLGAVCAVCVPLATRRGGEALVSQ